MTKLFHLSDILSVTTRRCVSCRHMKGVHPFLDFMFSAKMFDAELPNAAEQCTPWLQTQFPQLMADSPGMPERIAAMDSQIRNDPSPEGRAQACRNFVESVRAAHDLDEMLPVMDMSELKEPVHE